MRVSEEMMLGRHLVPMPKAGDFTRCAIGMANRSQGYGANLADNWQAQIKEHRAFITRHPWTEKLRVARCPVLDCVLCAGVSFTASISTMITHIFDWHVMGAKDFTFEQLCDWVRSIEPPEDEEKSPSDVCPVTDAVGNGLNGPEENEHVSV